MKFKIEDERVSHPPDNVIQSAYPPEGQRYPARPNLYPGDVRQ